jgi:hypothetical protein
VHAKLANAVFEMLGQLVGEIGLFLGRQSKAREALGDLGSPVAWVGVARCVTHAAPP